MSFKLRSLRQDLLFTDQVVSTTSYSKEISLDEIEGPASIQLIWENGDGAVNMDVSVQFSNDKIHWTTVSTTTNNITADTGSVFWDFQTGAEFARVEVAVNAGSAEFSALFNGKSR